MSSAPPAAEVPPRLWVGLLAVLLGAVISTLTGRLSSFGLADIRGAVGAGFDEGSWITTAQTTGQMLVGPLSVWAANVFGVRRVLYSGALVLALASFLLPFSPNLETLLALQFLAGVGSGVFVPLTVAFVLRSFPPKMWAIGIAAYCLNLELSLNISASIEGWYIDYHSWHWIFWQNVPLAIAMAICVAIGVPRQEVDRTQLRRADGFGMTTAALGFSCLYAALDQGNRLDWLGSPLIIALLVASALFLAAFLIHQARTPSPWIDLKLLGGGYLPILLLLIAELRFSSLATAYLVPQYLVIIRGFRPPEVGDILIWVAIPQLLAAPLAAVLLRRIDPRLVCASGLLFTGGACWIAATSLTSQWAAEQFLPTQLMQGLGQTLGISGAIFIGALRLRPADAGTFGAMLQTARLLGGEVGVATMATFARKSEQAFSYTLGLHVQSGAWDVQNRLAELTAYYVSQGVAMADARARATVSLAQAVRTQAYLLAYIDAFMLVAVSVLFALGLLALFRPHASDHPAAPRLWPARTPQGVPA